MKKAIGAILAIICLLSLFAVVIGCQPEEKKEPPLTTLAAPTGLALKDGRLTWNKVEGAKTYTVKVGEKEYTTDLYAQDIYEAFTTVGEVEVSVVAVNGTVTSDKASMKVTAEKLPVPQVSVVTEGNKQYFSWPENENAVSYMISLNGGAWRAQRTNEYTPVKAGDYTISVKYVGTANDNKAYITGDASAVSDKITISDRPVLTVNNATGVISFTTIENAASYDLYLDGELAKKNVESGLNLYDELVTATGEYTLEVYAVDADGETISVSQERVFSTPWLNENEIYSFDNAWDIQTNQISPNVLHSFVEDKTYNNSKYSMKVEVTNDQPYGRIQIILTGRDELMAKFETAKFLSYWVYVEKPEGYTKDSIPVATLPYLFDGEARLTGMGMLVDGSSNVPLEQWVQIFLPVPTNWSTYEVIGLTIGCSKDNWLMDDADGSFNQPLDFNYTFYMDDFYIYEPDMDLSSFEDYFEATADLVVDKKFATEFSGGTNVDVSMTFKVMNFLGNKITGNGSWVRRFMYPNGTYVLIEKAANGFESSYPGGLPEPDEEITITFTAVLDADGTFTITFADFPAGEIVGFTDITITEKNVTMSTPTGLTLSNGRLTWDAVQDAESYIVKVGEQEFTVQSCEKDIYDAFITEGAVEVSVVAARGNVKSDKAVLQVTVEKLSAPQVSVVAEDNKYFSWQENENAVGYMISVNDGEWVAHNTNQYAPIEAGEYTISVKYVGTANGNKVYLSSDPSALSEKITIYDRPVLSIDAETGVLTFTEMMNVASYDLYLDGVLAKENVESGINLYDESVFTKTGEYKLEVYAINDQGETVAVSNEVPFATTWLNENEIYSFDNAWDIQTNDISPNFKHSFVSDRTYNDSQYSMKVEITNDQAYGRVQIILTGRDDLMAKFETAKFLSYWVYVEKPAGYTKDTVPARALPFLLDGTTKSAAVGMLGDGSGYVPFDQWVQIFLPIPANWSNYEVMGLTIGCSKDDWAVEGADGSYGQPLDFNYTFYMDDFYIYESDMDLSSFEDYFEATADAVVYKKFATEFSEGTYVNVSMTFKVMNFLGKKISGNGGWVRRFMYPTGNTYVLLESPAYGFTSTYPGGLPEADTVITINFTAKLDADGTFTITFADFTAGEVVGFTDITVTDTGYTHCFVAPQGTQAEMKIATGYEEGSNVVITLVFNVMNNDGSKITGNGGWGRRFSVGDQTYWLLESEVSGNNSTYPGGLPEPDADITLTANATVDAEGNCTITFYDFNLNETVGFSQVDVVLAQA